VETLKLLDGIFDIYMPDFKFTAATLPRWYAEAPDYPQVVTAALKECTGRRRFEMDEDGIAMRGLLVRHLVLPEGLREPRGTRFLAREISRNTYVNIMDQYHPCGAIIPPASPLAGESQGKNSGSR